MLAQRALRALGGEITVDAREFRDGSSPNSPRTMGIPITVRETGRLDRENTSYIDAEEIDSLLKGIEYISKVTKGVTKLEQFEVDYRTKGDLRSTVFNSRNGDTSAVVSTGAIGRTKAYVKLAELETLRELIATAKSQL